MAHVIAVSLRRPLFSSGVDALFLLWQSPCHVRNKQFFYEGSREITALIDKAPVVPVSVVAMHSKISSRAFVVLWPLDRWKKSISGRSGRAIKRGSQGRRGIDLLAEAFSRLRSHEIHSIRGRRCSSGGLDDRNNTIRHPFRFNVHVDIFQLRST